MSIKMSWFSLIVALNSITYCLATTEDQIPPTPNLNYRETNSGAQVNVYDGTILECVFENIESRHSQVPLIYWEFTNGPLIMTNQKYSVSYGHALHIVNVTEKATSDYLCRGSTSRGSIVHHVLLNVTYKKKYLLLLSSTVMRKMLSANVRETTKVIREILHLFTAPPCISEKGSRCALVLWTHLAELTTDVYLF